MLCLLLSVGVALPGVAAPPEPPLTFHAAFEGSVDALSRGEGAPVTVEGPVEFRAGRLGQALVCGDGAATLRYATEGVLRATSGSVEMWVCPLDWTGQEDEFHVFLEARDPGWLVFYRYYQGGILTLLGADPATYRAAAGLRIDWKPGEWHHLAGTWRAKRLEVYIDGARAGVVNDPPLPERLAETFRLGDDPWHVQREPAKHTLIDEVKLYSVPLNAEAIAAAARGEAFTYTPEVVLDLTVDPEAGELHVACDAAGVVGELGTGRRARVELTPEAGGGPLAQAEISDFPRDMGETTLAVGEVPEGAYRVQATLLDAAGGVVAEASAPFTKPGPPVWSGNTLGMEDEVLPPWTPLKTGPAPGIVECWGREYEFSAFPDKIRSGGADLLASPVALEAVLGESAVPMRGAQPKVEQAGETRCVLTASGKFAASLTASVRQEIEYDGFVWTDLTVDAGYGAPLDELRLTWTMPAAQATLFHADQLKWIGNPAGALKPEGWSSEWTHFVWVGNEDRGLAWFAESPRNWVASAEKPAIEVKPEGDVVRVTLRLIAKQTDLQGRREYAFGMMATPARPRPADARRWRMAAAPRATFEIIWPNANMKWYGYPEPIDGPAFAERVKAAHEKGVQVVPYVNLNYCSGGAPEWLYYRSRWASDPPRDVLPSDVAQMGHASMGVCPANRDWQDFILYRINEAIEKYGIDGIYIDCWCPYPCQAPPCGWTDAEGKAQPTRPLRAYREIIRRVYALCRETRPTPLLMVHMSSEVVIPMLSFTDTLLDGEQFRSAALKDDYLEFLPPDMFRAEFLGRNYGPVEFYLPEFGDEHKQAGSPNLAAYLLLHDVSAWLIWCDPAPFLRLHDTLDPLGIAEAEFLPYWKGSGASTDAQVLASAYVAEGGVVLAVMNTGEATEAKLVLDLERLKLAGLAGGTDLLRDEALAAEGNTLIVPLARHQGRVIQVR
ncbi:MAG: hypothetical protein FJX74_05650 [Armatimonadetes bacterium]|nr:hypothetical protein [Armatimonadota bacterium]